MGGVATSGFASAETFRNGAPLGETIKELERGSLSVADLQIRVIDFNGISFALDNRRLRCAHSAFPATTHRGLGVIVLLSSLQDPVVPREWQQKFTVGQRIPYHGVLRESLHKTIVGTQACSGQGHQHGKPKLQGGADVSTHISPLNVDEHHPQSNSIHVAQPPRGGQTKIVSCAACGILQKKCSFSLAQLRRRRLGHANLFFLFLL